MMGSCRPCRHRWWRWCSLSVWPLQTRWAMRWWPDLAGKIDDVISMAGPHHGAPGADMVCVSGSCAPAVHQMRTGSRFLAALNAGDETPGGGSWTAVVSVFDKLVQPPATARLEGAVVAEEPPVAAYAAGS